MARPPNQVCIKETPLFLYAPRKVLLVDCAIDAGLQWTLYLSQAKDLYASRFPNSKPAPSIYHRWGIRVGDYLHRLQRLGEAETLTGQIYYRSERVDEVTSSNNVADLNEFFIGYTTINDAAIQERGIEVIASMDIDYDILFNNCQLFALKLAKLICTDPPLHFETFASTFDQINSMELDVVEASKKDEKVLSKL